MPRYQEKPHIEDLKTIGIGSIDTSKHQIDTVSYIMFNGQQIHIKCTAPNFGGVRCWYQCPTCSKNKANLYFYRGLWMCSKCTGLLYQSQSYDKKSQAALQAQKLRDKLDSGYKPKSMRWRTYERICQDIEYYDNLFSMYATEGLYKRFNNAAPNGKGILSRLKPSIT